MAWLQHFTDWIYPISLLLAAASMAGAVVTLFATFTGPSNEMVSGLSLFGACLKMMALFLIVAGVWS